MLRQKTREEGQQGKVVPRHSGNALEQVYSAQQALIREFYRMTWWHVPLLILSLFHASLWVLAVLYLIVSPGDSRVLYPVLLLLMSIIVSIALVLGKQPTTRWSKGIHTLLEQSKRVTVEEAVRPLLYIAYLDSQHIYRRRYESAMEFYDLLAQVLTRITEFTPNNQEHRLLQRIALSPFRYPEPLRIAALLILGDQPERLDRKFRRELEARIPKELNQEFVAAANDVLAR